MADVTIHRCTLRLVRRGGWSWGEDPKGLARAAVRALEGLLERQVAEAWPDGAEGEITAPLRIHVRAGAAELARELVETARDGYATALEQRFRDALAQTLSLAVPPLAPRARNAADNISPLVPAATADPVQVLWEILMAWRRRGTLEVLLAALDGPALAAWDDAFFAASRRPTRRAGQGRAPRPVLGEDTDHGSESVVAEFAGGQGRAPKPLLGVGTDHGSESAVAEFAALDIDAFLRSAVSSPPRDAVGVRRARIVAAVALMAERGRRPDDPDVIEALNRVWPIPATATQDRVRFDPGPTPESVSTRPERPEPDGTFRSGVLADQPHEPARAAWSAPRASTARGGDVHSAVPFLLLGPLARAGYLDALGAVLGGAGLSDEGSLFATALAYKVLSPPDRGWRRTPAEETTAALFAGLDAPAPGPALAAFARKVAPFLPALDLILADALARGHEPGQPLVLLRAGGGWLLAEAEGLFPIAWSVAPEGLFDALRWFGESPLLVPGECAEGDLMRRLDAEGVEFVTDAPPARGEAWRSLWRPEGRCWTNLADAPGGRLAASAQRLGPMSEALADCWRELAERRPGVAPSEGGPLERSLTLASGVALAEVAWTLWHDRDGGPQLALERFGNLDARIRFGPDEVRVTLPLGKRSLDLAKHGLLNDVHGVPWLGGRVVRFSGGGT